MKHILGDSGTFEIDGKQYLTGVGGYEGSITDSAADVATVITEISSVITELSDGINSINNITSASATINSDSGTPTVSVSVSGETNDKTLNFTFKNLKGDKGNSVKEIFCVEGPTGTVKHEIDYSPSATNYYRIQNDADGLLDGYIAVTNGTPGIGGGSGDSNLDSVNAERTGSGDNLGICVTVKQKSGFISEVKVDDTNIPITNYGDCFVIVDEDNNIGLKLDSDGLFVKEVTAKDEKDNEHKLTEKADLNYDNTFTGENKFNNGIILNKILNNGELYGYIKVTADGDLSLNSEGYIIPGPNSGGFKGKLKGEADKADALTVVSKGSSIQPVYFDKDGKPVECGFTVERSVPLDAKFTDTDTVPCIQIETASTTAAKVGTCANYSLAPKSYVQANVKNDNNAQSALTLSVNGISAKPIYINGIESSSSNYTLPAGTYIIYYDGTNYHFRTDGVLPGSILNAKNLTDAPNLSIGPEEGNTIFVTVGGKSSNFFTVPYATDATNADKLKIGLGAGSGEKKLSICTTTLAQSGVYGDVYQIPNIYLNDEDGIFTIGYETVIDSPCEMTDGLFVSGGDIYVYDGNITCDYSINASGGFIGNLTGNVTGTATNATNDGGGNNISATYALKADFESFTEIGSLKNPNAIKFKNTSGTVITYDGSSAADLSGGVYYAANAGSATSATNSTNVHINGSNKDEALPILFTTWNNGTASSRAVYMDSTKSFYYNPYTNAVTTTGTMNASIMNAVNGFFETSDERLKDIVKPISVDLDQLSKLRKVYFNWKDKEKFGDTQQLGMIAQDVQELYPELISESNGQLSLSYEKLSVIALEAIDVLHNENNELKSRIEKLESLVNQLNEK